jgi:hypothetical protein
MLFMVHINPSLCHARLLHPVTLVSHLWLLCSPSFSQRAEVAVPLHPKAHEETTAESAHWLPKTAAASFISLASPPSPKLVTAPGSRSTPINLATPRYINRRLLSTLSFHFCAWHKKLIHQAYKVLLKNLTLEGTVATKLWSRAKGGIIWITEATEASNAYPSAFTTCNQQRQPRILGLLTH